ncbi:Uncharacterised protein [BD1-7 clade bacterium]|nr:Uncharacterised protein [BD1-7 clade bacterium]
MSEYDAINLKLSAEIFRELMSGKIINRLASVDGDDENPLFSEISTRTKDYTMHYAMAGFELVSRPDFFYIRERNSESPYTEPVKKIQGLLLIISRYITKRGFMFDRITSKNAGLTHEDINNIIEDDEYQEIMSAIEIKDFMVTFKSHLLDRGIMQEIRSGKYLLTAAGSYFFDDLFARSTAESSL